MDSFETPADTLLLKGGARLRGEIEVAGALDTALPLLAAGLLTEGRSSLRHVPDVGDVRALLQRLRAAGAATDRRGATVSVDPRAATPERQAALEPAPRLDVLLLGPLLARQGEARIILPAGATTAPGDELYAVLEALAGLGAEVASGPGLVVARTAGLHGATVAFDRISATATQALMLAAVLASGRSTLEHCACDPEVEELGRALNKMGARVTGAGTSLIAIEGVEQLAPLEHALHPDRIEAGVLLVAAAITRGNLLLRDCAPEPLAPVLAKLRASGVDIAVEAGGLRVQAGDLGPADIVTRPHPGFPGGLLAPFTALMTRAAGRSVLTDSEGLFPGLDGDGEGEKEGDVGGRFGYVSQLVRLGADVAVEGRTALVHGPARLKGAQVALPRDRGGLAAVLLAALAAEGTTEILRVSHLDRGYERLDRRLRAVGAEMRRTRGGPQRQEETTS